MSDLIEYSFQSQLLDWIRYFKSTRQLHVRFQTGGVYNYFEVPAWQIEELVNAPSAGRYFLQNIAHRYKYIHGTDKQLQPSPNIQPPPQRIEPIFKNIKEQSLTSIRDYLPSHCFEAVSQLFDINPALVRVVKARKSKHADHRFSPTGHYSIITINHSGNGYHFLITLLHELAHAKTQTRMAYSRRVPPHGSEWKYAFSGLLCDFLARELFPEMLAPHVRHHAANPRYTTDSDRGLLFALRNYETLDLRPTLIDLPDGGAFTLDDNVVLIKGERRKNHFRCIAPDGRSLYVGTLSRVNVVNSVSDSSVKD